MHLPTDRIAHTTAFVTPVVEHWLGREIAGMNEYLMTPQHGWHMNERLNKIMHSKFMDAKACINQ